MRCSNSSPPKHVPFVKKSERVGRHIKLPATTRAHGQLPSNNGHRVPQTRAARTTRNEPRHRNRYQTTPKIINDKSKPGMAGYKQRVHRDTHTRTPEPGVAGRSRNQSQSTHSHTAHPSQVWRGTSRARTQPHQHQHPSKEWLVADKTRAQAHTPTHTHTHNPARSGGAQPKSEPKHTHQHRTPPPGLAGYKRSTHTNTHRPQQPGQEWRGAAETRAQAHIPTPHSPTRCGRTQRKPELKHTHSRRTPQAGVAGYKRSAHTNTHRPQHPCRQWSGAAKN